MSSTILSARNARTFWTMPQRKIEFIRCHQYQQYLLHLLQSSTKVPELTLCHRNMILAQRTTTVWTGITIVIGNATQTITICDRIITIDVINTSTESIVKMTERRNIRTIENRIGGNGITIAVTEIAIEIDMLMMDVKVAATRHPSIEIAISRKVIVTTQSRRVKMK